VTKSAIIQRLFFRLPHPRTIEDLKVEERDYIEFTWASDTYRIDLDGLVRRVTGPKPIDVERTPMCDLMEALLKL
jgi:hypothetical protein